MGWLAASRGEMAACAKVVHRDAAAERHQRDHLRDMSRTCHAHVHVMGVSWRSSSRPASAQPPVQERTAEVHRDSPRFAEIRRDSPRCAEMRHLVQE